MVVLGNDQKEIDKFTELERFNLEKYLPPNLFSNLSIFNINI